MAFGSMDITSKYFNDISTELKHTIMSFIKISKLVSYTDTKVSPIIDEYIKDYIDTRLFTNSSTFTFLRRSKLYGEIVSNKIKEMATIWVKDFMSQCKLLDETPDEKKKYVVFLDIKYDYFGEDRTNPTYIPKITHFRYYKNSVSIECHDSLRKLYMKEETIIDILVGCIDIYMHNDKGIHQISSIEFGKSCYDTSSPDYQVTDILDRSKGISTILKKYY